MKKLDVKGDNFHINNIKQFKQVSVFPESVLRSVFDFAYTMAYGSGEHRDHRSGGDIKRKNGEIFINTFQGKLSEIAVYNQIIKLNQDNRKLLDPIDFSMFGLGVWDDFDLKFGEIKFSIKSTKFYGNLLLLETKDWNNLGEYLHSDSVYDFHVLVRIKPDGENEMKKNKILYSNEPPTPEELSGTLLNLSWSYDIGGFISQHDLQAIIKGKFIIPKNALLNGSVKMDAENYYVQSGDLRCFDKLILSL